MNSSTFQRRPGAPSKSIVVEPTRMFVPTTSGEQQIQPRQGQSTTAYALPNDRRGLEPPSPGIHIQPITQSRYLKSMSKISVMDTSYEEQIEKNYDELKTKMFRSNKPNETNLEEDLMLRSIDRKKKLNQDGELQERYINFRERMSENEKRLKEGILEVKLERDVYNELYAKVLSGIRFDDGDREVKQPTKYEFPLASQQRRMQSIPRQKVIGILEDEQLLQQQQKQQQQLQDVLLQQQQQKAKEEEDQEEEDGGGGGEDDDEDGSGDSNDGDNDGEGKKGKKKKKKKREGELVPSDEAEEEFVTEDDTVLNQEDRSNFDLISMASRSKSTLLSVFGGGEREWEYSSQRDYNITEIQKLTELLEYEVLTTFMNNSNDILTDIVEEQELWVMEQHAKAKQRAKRNLAMKRRRVANSKVEKSQEEQLELDINEKTEYFFNYDNIVKISLCFVRASDIHPENLIQIQREISDQARDILCLGEEYRGPFYEDMRANLLQIDDIYIDENVITFDDISNIISERVPERTIYRPIDPEYLHDHFNRHLSTIDSKQMVEELMYTNDLSQIKQFEFAQMKSFTQRTKKWEDKGVQSAYYDIVGETKSVTDWLMEDLHHIRKATLSSQGFDFNHKVSKVLQTQLYHKLEEKLLLLLQIILYRKDSPVWKVPQKQKTIYDDDQEQIARIAQQQEYYRQERLKHDAIREEEEKKFETLHHSEVQMINDLKHLLNNINSIRDVFVDRREKSELLRIFLVDYNEIVKFKNHQLSKLAEIDNEIQETDTESQMIRNKTVFQRLYEEKIGKSKKDINLQKSYNKMIEGFTQKVLQLNQKRDSILLNSAQLFPVVDADSDAEMKKKQEEEEEQEKKKQKFNRQRMSIHSRSSSAMGGLISRTSSGMSQIQKESANQFSRQSQRSVNEESGKIAWNSSRGSASKPPVSANHLTPMRSAANKQNLPPSRSSINSSAKQQNSLGSNNRSGHRESSSNSNSKFNSVATSSSKQLSTHALTKPSVTVKPFSTPIKDRQFGGHSHSNSKKVAMPAPSSLQTVMNTDWQKILKIAKH